MDSTHTRHELAGLLSQNVGIEKASELIGAAADQLGFDDALTVDQSLQILESVATQPGLVGITARFAKSRVLLRWGAAPARKA